MTEVKGLVRVTTPQGPGRVTHVDDATNEVTVELESGSSIVLSGDLPASVRLQPSHWDTFNWREIQREARQRWWAMTPEEQAKLIERDGDGAGSRSYWAAWCAHANAHAVKEADELRDAQEATRPRPDPTGW